MNLTEGTYLTTPKEQFQQFTEHFAFKFRPHSQSKVCWIYKLIAGYWNYQIQSILAQKRDYGPMNLTEGTYLTTPEEQFQQFTETFALKFRPHSQSNVCRIYKSLARYWNYQLQSILAQKRDNGPMNLTKGKYLTTPEDQFQQFTETFAIKFSPHSQSNVCRIYKSLAGYWNYQFQSILAQKRNHGPMNLTQGTYLTYPEEQFQQFTENFAVKFRPHSQSNVYRIYKSLAGYWNYQLQSILAQRQDNEPMNLTVGTYLTTPEEQFQQFTENIAIKFRSHSQSKFCQIFKSLAGYRNYQLQSILAQKMRTWTHEFDVGKLLDYP